MSLCTLFLHRQNEVLLLISQGAPEKILSACGYALTSAAEVVHLSDSTRQGSQLDVFVMQSKVFHMLGIESHIKQMTRRSLRVLCVAHADFGSIGKSCCDKIPLLITHCILQCLVQLKCRSDG